MYRVVGKTYQHSAYWYAYNKGWTHSDKRSFAEQYLDFHTYRPRMKSCGGIKTYGDGRSSRSCGSGSGYYGARGSGRGYFGEWKYGYENDFDFKKWKKWRESSRVPDSNFNLLLFGACIAMDIGVAMRHHVKTLKDPVERDRIKRELMRDLRVIRRPFYYEREKARRRELAAERRKIRRSSTTAPMPTPESIMAAWEKRKDSQEAMIVLGGMLHDLECYVDNCLKFDNTGAVVGRNGGIRGWLKENLPELAPKYKTLMRYKALAVRLRQVTETKDPTPTSSLLDEPRKEKVVALLAETKPFFTHVFEYLEHELSAETVFLDHRSHASRLRRTRKGPTKLASRSQAGMMSQ